jgi:hypothetical protein
VKLLEFTITAKQLIASIWTLIAIVLSIIIVIGIDNGVPWWALVALFFGLLLVIALPVFLLLALWQVLAKSDTA